MTFSTFIVLCNYTGTVLNPLSYTLAKILDYIIIRYVWMDLEGLKHYEMFVIIFASLFNKDPFHLQVHVYSQRTWTWIDTFLGFLSEAHRSVLHHRFVRAGSLFLNWKK